MTLGEWNRVGSVEPHRWPRGKTLHSINGERSASGSTIVYTFI